MKSKSLDPVIDFSITSILLYQKPADLVQFIKDLGVKKNVSKLNPVQLIDEAKKAFFRSIKKACAKKIINKDRVKILNETAKKMHIPVPKKGQNACTFYNKYLTNTDKLNLLVQDAKSNKQFWKNVGNAGQPSKITQHIWKFLNFMYKTMRKLMSNQNVRDFLLVIGATTIYCKNNPQHCANKLSHVLHTMCDKKSNHIACRVLRKLVCTLLGYIGRYVGAQKGQWYDAEVTKNVMKDMMVSVGKFAMSNGTAVIPLITDFGVGFSALLAASSAPTIAATILEQWNTRYC
jgi:hypothetical protein